MDKLNMKLAKWRFPDSAINDMGDHLWVHWPFGREHWLASESIKPFTESLDACDKWLVPNIKDLSDILFHPHGGSCSIILRFLGSDRFSDGEGNTSALALCLAIEKLIDKEEPNEGNQNSNPTA